MEVGPEALRLERAGGWTAADAVSVDEALVAAVVYKHGGRDIGRLSSTFDAG